MGAASGNYEAFNGNERIYQENEKEMLRGETPRENYEEETPRDGLLQYGERATNPVHTAMMLDLADEVSSFERGWNLVNKTIKYYVERHIKRRQNVIDMRQAAIPRIVETEDKIDGRENFRADVTHVLSDDYRDKAKKYKPYINDDKVVKDVPLDKKQVRE
ncbi:MAG: hypothetical protein SVK08_01595 [Halobacteriota archaeon]|nr:hypothetical protein [Halobacteriota archaeon]